MCREETSDEGPKHAYVVVRLDEAVDAPFTRTVLATDEECAELTAVAHCNGKQDYGEGDDDNGYKALMAFDSEELIDLAAHLKSLESKSKKKIGSNGSRVPDDYVI